MKLTDVFDRTFVLNLPSRADRRREMGQVLKKAGMGWEPGKVELFEATRVASADPFINIGAHGCYLSHLRMLKAGQALGVSRLLIMEDDLEISPVFPQVVDFMANRLAKDDWGFAYLGHNEPIQNPTGASPSLVPVQPQAITNHFYAIHGQLLDRVIEYLELVLTRPPGHPDGGPMHVDGAYTMFRQQNPDVLTLIARPNLGWQRPSSSDISVKWVDQAPIIRHLSRAARLIKRRINPLPR